MTQITEAVQQAACLQVDLEAGVIRGVKVCGNRSKNGRYYPPEVLESAALLYEGVPVYLNHGLLPGDEREIDVHVGNLQNVHLQEGELFADLHYLKSHPQAASIVERAERFANNFGLSHDAEIEAIADGQGQRVTRIVAVHSVDLVTRPATNHGIFEQEQNRVSQPTRTFKQLIESLSVNQYAGKFAVLEQMERDNDPRLATPIAEAESDDTPPLKRATRQLVLAVLDDTSLDESGMLSELARIVRQQQQLLGEEVSDASESVNDSWRNRALSAEAELAGTREQVIESVLRQHAIEPTQRLVRTLRQLSTREAMLAYLDGEDIGQVLESNSHPIHAADAEDLTSYEPAQDDQTFLSRMRM